MGGFIWKIAWQAGFDLGQSSLDDNRRHTGEPLWRLPKILFLRRKVSVLCVIYICEELGNVPCRDSF